MTSTLRIPVSLTVPVVVHEIEGGGFWGEVPQCPGCLAQADTEAELKANILQAIVDWFSEVSEKTEQQATQLAAIQGDPARAEAPHPQAYDYIPSPSWSEEDE